MYIKISPSATRSNTRQLNDLYFNKTMLLQRKYDNQRIVLYQETVNISLKMPLFLHALYTIQCVPKKNYHEISRYIIYKHNI